MMSRTALCGGYVVLDLILSGDGVRRVAGGTAANVAAILSFLGWETSVIGRIGQDEAGELVRTDLRQAGVDTELLRLDAAAVTPVIRHSASRGRPQYRRGCRECKQGSANYVHLAESEAESIVERGLANVFVFDRPSPVNLALAEAHAEGGSTVLYEPSTSSTPTRHARASAAASIVKYSRQKQKNIEPRLAEPHGTQIRVRTSGADGAEFSVGRGEIQHVPGYDIEALDAGGAGDWTTATLLDCLTTGFSPPSVRDAVELAQSMAALSTLMMGARTLMLAGSRDSLWDEAARLRAGARPTLSATVPNEEIVEGRCPGCGL